MDRKKVIILGAAGRDFHNFDSVFQGTTKVIEVVGFTATQIPGIEARKLPRCAFGPSLSRRAANLPGRGPRENHPASMTSTIAVLSYSDLSYGTVMHLASRCLAAGADFMLLGRKGHHARSSKPVIAVTAVRTGCGKSQVSRHVADLIHARGLKTVAIRHPMPYGDLAEQRVQRFAGTRT